MGADSSGAITRKLEDAREISVKKSPQATGARPKKYMFLRLGSSTFAVPLSSIREVLGMGQVSHLPNMPNFFAGLVNLRGKIVSAVFLRKSLSFLGNIDTPENISKRPCIVIIEVHGRLFGAIVDDVIEVQAVPDSIIDHAADNIHSREVFMGIIKREGQELAPILNLVRALKIDELTAFSKFRSD